MLENYYSILFSESFNLEHHSIDKYRKNENENPFECGHNYCEGCLITVRNGQDEWQCPETRRPHKKNVEDLTRNYLVERFLDAYNKEQKEKAASFDDGLCDLHERPFELCK